MRSPYNFIFWHAELGFVDCEVTFTFDKQIEVWVAELDPDDKHNMLPVDEFEFYEQVQDYNISIYGQHLNKNLLICLRKNRQEGEIDLFNLSRLIKKAQKRWEMDKKDHINTCFGLELEFK